MKDTTILALDWAIRSFGADHVYDRPVRALRCAEEAVELAQAYHVPKEKMHELVDIVYSRPVGQCDQEIGGVMMTITVLAATNGADPHDYLMHELRRVLSKSPEHFAQRNQEKIDLGLEV